MRKLTLACCLLFAACFSLTVCAQLPHDIDSLIQASRHAPQDTQRVAAFNFLAQAYSSSDLEQAMVYARSALELAQEKDLKNDLADAYNTAGIICAQAGRNKEAFFCFDEGSAISAAIGEKPSLASSNHMILMIRR